MKKNYNPIAFGKSKLTDEELGLLSSLVYKKFGIVLNEKKRELVVGRLQGQLRKKNLSTFKEYYNLVVNDSSGIELLTLIDKISTNHTYFFRESDHFDYFIKTTLPLLYEEVKKNREKEIRLWCAASSSGEEPYTLMMLACEFFETKKDIKFKILATDISKTALEKAKNGIYDGDNVSRIPKKLLNKYFDKINADQWKVKRQLSDNIMFRRFNLMSERFPFKNKFHIIFCRNVMIYFDVPTKENLVNKFSSVILSGGNLFIGHSESIKRPNENFDYVMPALYKRKQY